MGFYPVMMSEVQRQSEGGRRYVRARVFDNPLGKWINQDFEGWDDGALTKALEWIKSQMIQLEM
jgi:hypothetical protein